MFISYIHILIIDLLQKRIFSQLFNGLKGYVYGVMKEEKVGRTTINIDTLQKNKKVKSWPSEPKLRIHSAFQVLLNHSACYEIGTVNKEHELWA